MERFFHIEDVDSEELYVIILSNELTSVYWEELLENEESRLLGNLRRCQVSHTLDEISRKFFALHSDLLIGSNLSNRQIEHYLCDVL